MTSLSGNLSCTFKVVISDHTFKQKIETTVSISVKSALKLHYANNGFTAHRQDYQYHKIVIMKVQHHRVPVYMLVTCIA